jgi:pyridoxamine 5'-phosphate oxidase
VLFDLCRVVWSRTVPPESSGDEKMPNPAMHVNAFQREIRPFSLGVGIQPRSQTRMPRMKLADLRQEYMRSGLSETQAEADPLRQFERWFQDALGAGLALPNAMTLATADAAGKPSARVVLLKGIDGNGFVFYTNYRSRKARELEAQPSACLVFIWSELERQVRVEGRAEKVSGAESDAYFVTRPAGARLSAWASPQSERVKDRLTLEKAMQEVKARHGEAPPRPPSWGGYRLLPEEIEFWQGRADRLHDRLLYTRSAGGWRIERLAP